MSQASPQLTLIFVTHNSAAIIGECLQTCMSDAVSIIIADNASTDDTRSIARSICPQAQILALPDNLGYGAAVNRAIAQTTTPYALLLNPDVLASPDAITRLLQQHIAHQPCAMSSCLIQTPKEDGQMVTDFVTPIDVTQPVNWVPRVLGAVMLFDVARMQQNVGWFDEHIFMYYEDDELCKRAIRLGERIAIFPDIVFTHLAGQSSPHTMAYRKLKAWHLIWAKLYYRKLDRGLLSAYKLNIAFLLRFAYKWFVHHLTGQLDDARLEATRLQAALSFLIGQPAYYRLHHAEKSL